MRSASLAIVAAFAALAAPARADEPAPPVLLPPPAPEAPPAQPAPEAPPAQPAPEAPPLAPAAAEEPAPAPEEPAPAAGAQGRVNYDGQVFHAPIRPREIVVEVPGTRSRTNKLVLWSTLIAGSALGALGAYYNLESRDAADAVSAQRPTGRAWTEADDETVRRGERAGDRAAIFYGLGGALIVGTIAGFIITAPKPGREVIRPHFAIGPGGGVIGGAWAW